MYHFHHESQVQVDIQLLFFMLIFCPKALTAWASRVKNLLDVLMTMSHKSWCYRKHEFTHWNFLSSSISVVLIYIKEIDTWSTALISESMVKD